MYVLNDSNEVVVSIKGSHSFLSYYTVFDSLVSVVIMDTDVVVPDVLVSKASTTAKTPHHKV